MRHNNKIIFGLLVLLSSTGCNKYLDVNQDPNRVTDANVTPQLIFTQAEVAVGTRQASGTYTFLNHWVGYACQNGGFAPQADEITYTVDASFFDPIWQRNYQVLFDLNQAKLKALTTGDMGTAAASMVLSAKLFQEMVDMYGNIPYSQAFHVSETTTPAYDDAQGIYNALQLSLDSAIGLFGGTTISAFSNADVIAHGNKALWIAFANTLKLRLLIRQSQVSGFDPTAEIAKIEATGGPQGPGQDIGVNPGYVDDVNKQNPFYSNYGWSPTGVISDAADNANNYDLNLLGSNDPRLGRFWYPLGFSGSNFLGGDYGVNPNPVTLSYFGPGLVGDVVEKSGLFVGDGTGATKDMWIMPAFESMFFTAEAIARGWAPGGDAGAALAYNAAVTESFRFLGVPDADTTAKYFIINNPDKNYTISSGATVDSKVKFLALQKYIALTMIDPLEVYADIRRLNMLPDGYISQAPANSKTSLPTRFLYPQSEITTNNDNVKAQGDAGLYTGKIFWEP